MVMEGYKKIEKINNIALKLAGESVQRVLIP
jgi:hypothetical protein